MTIEYNYFRIVKTSGSEKVTKEYGSSIIVKKLIQRVGRRVKHKLVLKINVKKSIVLK